MKLKGLLCEKDKLDTFGNIYDKVKEFISRNNYCYCECSSSCFSLNNYVTMADKSLKLIKHVNIGDNVMSIDENGNVKKTEVIAILRYEKDSTSKYNDFITKILLFLFNFKGNF